MNESQRSGTAWRAVALICLCAALWSCAGGQQAPIEVRDAWSPAAPPGASTIAVYFEAQARSADALIGVSTPLADQADVHATTEVDGMMQMRPVARVDLPAGKAVKLAPGGMHVMLTGVHQPLAAGAQFPLRLKFANAGEVDVTVIVKAPG